MTQRGPTSVVFAGGARYFLVVFAVGFLLGIVRTLWLVPRFGERWAELIEMPVTEILRQIREAVEEFTLGSPADDDRTILLVKRSEGLAARRGST